MAAPVKGVPVASTCPMCVKEGTLRLLSTVINIPYFGDGLETMLSCDNCGFRHADFMITTQKDPLRVSFRADNQEALRVRVIRSNSGTIRIPELGFTAEPTPMSESFVSNVEGVLARAKEILLTARNLNLEDAKAVALIDDYLATWQRLSDAAEPFTLIIDDPWGNSAIVSENVVKERLTDEEVAQLQTGTIVIDADDARQAAEAEASSDPAADDENRLA